MLRTPVTVIATAVALMALAALAGPIAAWRQNPPGQAAVTLEQRERAYRANNIGVADLEQYDYDAAVKAFRDALSADPDLAIARVNLGIALFYAGDADAARRESEAAAARLPDSPQPQYVLGLLARAANDLPRAIDAFRKVLAGDPSDVGANVNLGQVYLQQARFDEAAAFFRKAVAGEAYNVTAAYGLAMALTRGGHALEGQQAMDRFQALRGTPYGKTYSQTYLEQGRYAEALASTGAEPELVDISPPDVAFEDVTAQVMPAAGVSPPGREQPPPKGRPLICDTSGGVAAVPSSGLCGSVTLIDLDNDGDLDLVEAGPRLRVWRNDAGRFIDVTAQSGLGALDNVIAAVAGDYDNDGRPDLFIMTGRGNQLWHQQPGGRFEDVTAQAHIPATTALARSAAMVDVDHDGDLDIFVGGGSDGTKGAGANQLLRNNGDGTFTDITAAAGVGGAGRTIGIVPTDFDNGRDIDLLVGSASGPPALFQNLRDGTFRDVASTVGLPSGASIASVTAADINKDSYPDFFFGRSDGPGVFALSDGRGRFVSKDGPPLTAGATIAQFIDYDNDGLLDLLTATSTHGLVMFRNIGSGRWDDVTSRARLNRLGSQSVQALAAGDIDRDGATDLVARLVNGEIRVWRNAGGARNRSVAVTLESKASNRSAAGVKVELRAGSLRQKLERAVVTPSIGPADVLFGLGARASADVVRVLWPSGILQAETSFASAGAQTSPRPIRVTVTELDRKPSSCPYLYTWNGTRFEFITDFMGGGEMGDWLAPATYSEPDSDEYVRIRGDQLRERDGRYELRMTNELEEAMFVDAVQLAVVDHPSDVDVYPNEGLKSPPRAPFRLYTTRGARPPVRAVDDHGHDVLRAISRMDRTYPDDFAIGPVRGYAAPHALTLDLGTDAANAVLLLTGWTDYAFSSNNVDASQRGLTMQPPAVEMQDPSGHWRPLIADMGFPVGRPQTVVVDLASAIRRAHDADATWRSASPRQVRIVTNMRIYWDQILVDTSGGGAPVRMTRLDPTVADLHFRGFSGATTPDGREPFGYDYDRVSRLCPWKLMPGRYTREGDVRELLRSVDDRFVVSRPGDEIALSFDVASLPRLEPGSIRTFLLYVDGFSKEMDINSASPQILAPMPFHGMRRYPDAEGARARLTQTLRDYMDEYNTRIVHDTLPPLDSVSSRVSHGPH